MAQDDRCGLEIVDDFPFMLRHSKHSELFSATFTLLANHRRLNERPE